MQINDVINNRIIIGVEQTFIKVKCLSCGKISKLPKGEKYIRERYCNCFHKNGLRFSGLVYTNSEEKLQEIKNKYKNGVTKKMITDWIDSVFK